MLKSVAHRTVDPKTMDLRATTLVLLAQQADPPSGPISFQLQVFGAKASGRPGHHRHHSFVESFHTTKLWDPVETFHAYFQTIESLKFQKESHSHVSLRRLRGLGIGLFERLLPEELQERLLRIYEAWCQSHDLAPPVLSLISNENWIPWELMTLGPSGPFLAEAFALSRSLLGWRAEPRLRMSKLAWVSYARTGLTEAPSELRALRSLLGASLEELEPRHEKVLLAMNQGEFTVWHFVCHGRALGKQADQSTLELQDENLLATDLNDGMAAVQALKPLVFLNSCSAGRGGPALTGIGGFAQAFTRAGCGAFLGPHWSVTDEAAAAFSIVFYRAMAAGFPIAEATRRARLTVKEEFPGDPTWLAYSLYADPWALGVFQAEPEGSEPSERRAGSKKEELTPVEPAEVALSDDSTRRPVLWSDTLVESPWDRALPWLFPILILILNLGWMTRPNWGPIAFVEEEPRRPTVAVFRTENVSSDQELDWLCVLLSEGLRQKLAIGDELLVLDRIEMALFQREHASSTLWDITDLELQRLRRALGADYFILSQLEKPTELGAIEWRGALHDTRTGRKLAEISETGEPEGWIQLLDRGTGGAKERHVSFRRLLGAQALSLMERRHLRSSFPRQLQAARHYAQALNALGQSRFRDAYQHSQEAVALEAHPEVLLTQAELAHRLGLWEEAEVAITAARSSLGEEGASGTLGLVREQLALEELESRIRFDLEGQVDALAAYLSRYPDDIPTGLLYVEALIRWGDPDGAQAVLEQIRELPRTQHRPSVEIAEAHLLLARESYEAAASRGRIAIEKASALKLGRDRAVAQLATATALGALGEEASPEAKHLFEEARQSFREIGDLWSEAECLESSASYYARFDLSIAVELLQSAVHQFELVGDQFGRIRSLYQLGSILESLGKTERAAELLDKAREISSNGFALYEGYAHLARGYRKHLGGEIDAAQREYELALKIFHRGDTQESFGVTLTNLGELEFLRGRLEESEKLHRQALTLHEAIGARASAAYDHIRLAKVFSARGKLQLAKRHLDLATPSPESDPTILIEAALGKARISLVTGRPNEAHEALAGALELAEALGDAGFLARVSALGAVASLEADFRQGQGVTARTRSSLEKAKGFQGSDFRADFEMAWTLARVHALDSDSPLAALEDFADLASRAGRATLKIHQLESLYWLGRHELEGGMPERGDERLKGVLESSQTLGLTELAQRIVDYSAMR